MACTDPTPPCVGSLWEHKDGERLRVRMSIFDDELGDCFIVADDRGYTFTMTAAEWSAWASDATRIDNAPRGEETT